MATSLRGSTLQVCMSQAPAARHPFCVTPRPRVAREQVLSSVVHHGGHMLSAFARDRLTLKHGERLHDVHVGHGEEVHVVVVARGAEVLRAAVDSRASGFSSAWLCSCGSAKFS